ncbi:MAG: hypothetical protein QM813_06250 [Verrucomicrobiota bacterium]
MNKFKIKLSALVVTALATGAANAYDLNLGKDQTVSFHGFLSQGYIASSEYNYLAPNTTDGGSFEFTEIGVNATYSPFSRTRIAVQGFAFDVGDVGNFNPILDYASLEYAFADEIGFRGGRIRKPGGIYNHIQDLDLARTSVLLPQGIYDVRWRDFSTSLDGAELFGNIPMNKAGSLSYEAFGGYMHLSDEGGIATLLKNSFAGTGTTLNGLDSFLNVGAQLWWNTPLEGFRVGGYVGNAFEFAYDYTAGGLFPARSESDAFVTQFSLEYLWKSWTFQAEYYSLALDGQSVMSTPFGAVVTPSTSHQDAWYTGAAYRFNSWLEVGSYYTQFYTSQGERNGPNDTFQKDLALSFRFDVKDWWIVKLEGHWIQGTALLRDNVANPPPHTQEDWFMLALKTTFSF